MGRLRMDTLERFEGFATRVVSLADALEKQRRSRRVIDQLTGAGTGAGANMFEADEAMSRADFVKCAAIVAKELNETRFWLRLITRCGWMSSQRVAGLETECDELRRIVGAMIVRAKRTSSVRPS
jgi:four helix bundle protein